MMPKEAKEDDLTPYPSQEQANEMVLAVAGRAIGLGEPRIVARDGDDLTPVMTQAQNDVALLIASGPPPGSQPPINKDVPFVDGSATVGGTLTCTMGNWTGEPTSYSYAWSAAGAADAATYVVQAADAGTSISCVVTATNANGSTAAAPSNAVAINGAAGTQATRRRG
jgi:hypothetical protein